MPDVDVDGSTDGDTGAEDPQTGDAPTLMLLDGHSLAYRAFFALPDDLRTRTGQLTNAVYGFTSMLIKLLSGGIPDGIVVTFDRGRDERRTELYPEYKAGRAETPDEFRTQLDLIKQVLEAFHIRVVAVPGVEADDVIASLAERGRAKGYQTVVVTGDRDAMQLVDDDITVLYTLRGITETAEMTPDAVFERYGVWPAQYVDYASLRGDTSDNLPGVPGVGTKTAAKLLDQFGDVDGVYAHIDDVGGKKLPQSLREHEEQVRLNLRMMRLRRDVDLDDLDLGDLAMGTPDLDAIRRLFGTLEFRVLYDRLMDEVIGAVEEDAATGFERPPHRLGPGDLRAWLDDAGSPLAVVPVVEGAVPRARWTAAGVAAPGRDPGAATLDDLAREDLDALAAALEDPAREIVTHDLKALDHAATSRGMTLAGVTVDTELAAYLLSPEQRSFDLEDLALYYLQRTLTTEADTAPDGQMALQVEDRWEDRALRAQAVLQLAGALGDVVDERGQRDLLDTVELPLAPVLARMERTGIAVDTGVLDDIRDRLAARAEELEREIWDLAGRRFNVGSGPQLQEVLFEDLGLPVTRRIKTGYSTDAQALKGLLDHNPIAGAVLEWREVTKLLTTYVDALPPLVDATTGRIHTTLSQTVAATGRLSSSNPNLQNVPVRREEGREIRRAFVPGEGFDRLLVADYSQIELRIMAHLSGDQGLLGAFAAGEDIHATTAARVFDLELEQVDAPLRDRAKAVNYGLAYGLTSYGLSQQLGIPPDEADAIVEAYKQRFPEVAAFLGDAVEQARRDGYTSTLFGRRRYLPDLLSGNRNRRMMAERMALNAPIQGTAADVIKMAMIRVQAALDRRSAPANMLLQVHDELLFELPENQLEAVRDLVVGEMAGVADLDVPLAVDTAVGGTWFDAQKH